MFTKKPTVRPSLTWMIASALSALVAANGYANEQPLPMDQSPTGSVVSQNVTVNLINRLVQRGVLKKDDAADLLLLAEADAADAKAQAAMTQAALAQAAAAQLRMRAYAAQLAAIQGARSAPVAATEPALPATTENAEDIPTHAVSKPARRAQATVPAAPDSEIASVATQNSVGSTDADREDVAPLPAPPKAIAKAALPPPPVEEPLPDDTVRVAYVPEVVKNQISEEVKQEVMDQARRENWAAPWTMPEWVTRFRLMGDIRLRYEGLFYPPGNDSSFSFTNFNAINTGSPFDISAGIHSPQYNDDQTRTRIRLRARLGSEIDLGNSFSAGLRFATGENNSPVTENQSLGLPSNGQGGDFSKYSLWLDRAFLKYEIWGLPDKDVTLSLGRFDNPFFATSIIWADEIGFDGLAIRGKYPLADDDFTPFFTIGAFPVFNTDLNYGTAQSATKFKSENKWLYAAQVGLSMEINKDFSAKIAGAIYDFRNIEGKLSDPYTPISASDAGDTDDTRPSFAQTGNTYMALRDITIVDGVNRSSTGLYNQFQYFGLATPFREAAFTARLDYNVQETFQVSLFGEYVKNMAFDPLLVATKAVNNLGPDTAAGAPGPFVGSGKAWDVNLKLGNPALEQPWNWNVTLGYRTVGSDAVVDGFTDADFGGGGTNLKGFTVAGSLALSPRVWFTLRWMSATQVAGPQLKDDIVQVDLNGKF